MKSSRACRMGMEKKLKSYHVSQFKTLELWRWKAIKSYLMHIWIFGTNLTPLSPLFPMSQKKSQKTHKHLKIVEYFCETLATENWRNLNYNNKHETLIHSIRGGIKKNCEKAVRLTAWVETPLPRSGQGVVIFSK